VTRASRIVFALAAGCTAAGAVEFLRTLRALGNLQFTPTADQPALFFAWTSAMLWSSLIVIASGALLMFAEARSKDVTPPPGVPQASSLRPVGGGAQARCLRYTGPSSKVASVAAIVATIVLAARVWENVSGYLTPMEGIPFEEHPLPVERWPFVYHHPWPLIAGVVVAILLAVAYAGWRARPRLTSILIGVTLVLAVVILGGNIGFTLVSFLRLRNWSIVVALLDVVVAAFAVRTRRDVAVVIALLLVITASAEIALAWKAMEPTSASLPANSIPRW